MKELKEKLKTEIDQCYWGLLEQNIERGAVFIIAGNLDILDVAVAFSEDRTNFIKLWLDQKDLLKIEMTDKERFLKSNFDYLIIQPYVIIKETGSTELQ